MLYFHKVLLDDVLRLDNAQVIARVQSLGEATNNMCGNLNPPSFQRMIYYNLFTFRVSSFVEQFRTK